MRTPPVTKADLRTFAGYVIATIAVVAGLLLIDRGIPSDTRGMVGSVILAGGVILFFITIAVVVGAFEDW